MGHPEVKWSIVSSCCLHNRHLLSISCFVIMIAVLYNPQNLNHDVVSVDASPEVLNCGFS